MEGDTQESRTPLPTPCLERARPASTGAVAFPAGLTTPFSASQPSPYPGSPVSSVPPFSPFQAPSCPPLPLPLSPGPREQKCRALFAPPGIKDERSQWFCNFFLFIEPYIVICFLKMQHITFVLALFLRHTVHPRTPGDKPPPQPPFPQLSPTCFAQSASGPQFRPGSRSHWDGIPSPLASVATQRDSRYRAVPVRLYGRGSGNGPVQRHPLPARGTPCGFPPQAATALAPLGTATRGCSSLRRRHLGVLGPNGCAEVGGVSVSARKARPFPKAGGGRQGIPTKADGLGRGLQGRGRGVPAG